MNQHFYRNDEIRMETSNPSDAALERILIVEDDPITARYLELALKRMGYVHTRIAQSSEQALAMLKAEPADLALMDIQIEGKYDGIETARMMGDQFDVPVIFLTGMTDEATITRAREADPLDYLVKPVKADDLRASLHAAAHRERTARTMRERESWFSATLLAVDEPMLGCDTKGRLVFINPAARQLLGVPAGTGSNAKFMDIVRLVDAQGVRAMDPMALRGTAVPATLLRPEGDLAVQVTGYPAMDLRDRALGIVLLIRSASVAGATESELRRLRGELSVQSLTDELTGLNNRRGLNVLGDQQLKVIRRGRTPVTLLTIAVQHLKEINDQFGRAAGDQALKDCAKVMRETFRESDLLCRLVGGEFVVMMNVADAAEITQRLSANIGSHNAAAGRAFQLKVETSALTRSAKDLQNIPELLAEADTSLTDGRRPP